MRLLRKQSQFFCLHFYLQGQFTEKQLILLTSVVSFVNEQLVFLNKSFKRVVFLFLGMTNIFRISFKTRGSFSE